MNHTMSGADQLKKLKNNLIKKNMEKTRTSFRIKEVTHERLRKIKKASHLTFSEIIEGLVKDFMDKNEPILDELMEKRENTVKDSGLLKLIYEKRDEKD